MSLNKRLLLKKKEFTKYLDKEGKERLRVKISVEKGSIRDIVVQYETYWNGDWLAIIRYDCAHGFFHRDVLFYRGEKEKQTIVIDNLQNALSYAEQDLKDRWEWYKKRYFKKLKK